jgi:hypothetical protein
MSSVCCRFSVENVQFNFDFSFKTDVWLTFFARIEFELLQNQILEWHFLALYNVFEIQTEILKDKTSTGSANTKNDVKRLGEDFHQALMINEKPDWRGILLWHDEDGFDNKKASDKSNQVTNNGR